MGDIRECLEVSDFAGVLRLMADNADHLAQRHDVAEMAGLRRRVAEQEVQVRRDADLIAELRRQLQSVWRQLDSIGRIRKLVLVGEAADGVQILVDALLILAGERCSTYTSGSCRDDRGRTRTAECTADAWCGECVAHDALERAGALPPVEAIP